MFSDAAAKPLRTRREFAPTDPADGPLFLIYITLIWIGMLLGFGREIARHIANNEPPYPMILHVHSAVFVTWLVAFIAQILLIVRLLERKFLGDVLDPALDQRRAHTRHRYSRPADPRTAASCLRGGYRLEFRLASHPCQPVFVAGLVTGGEDAAGALRLFLNMEPNNITHQFSSATNRRVANFLIALGVLLWIWLPYSYWKNLQFANGSVSTVAQIIADHGAPVIVFHDRSGNTVTAVLNGWRPTKLAVGQRIEILYSAKHPEQVALKSRLWAGQWLIAISAVVLCTFGWLMRKGIIVCGPLRQSRGRISF